MSWRAVSKLDQKERALSSCPSEQVTRFGRQAQNFTLQLILQFPDEWYPSQDSPMPSLGRIPLYTLVHFYCLLLPSLFNFFLIELYSIYNIVLISGVHQRGSGIYIYFQIIFRFRLLQDTEYRSLCYPVNPCCFSVLCMCLVAQSCPTLCDPMDCSPPGSSIHEDSPGKNTRVGCHALLQGIFPTQGLNPGLLHCRQVLYHLCH